MPPVRQNFAHLPTHKEFCSGALRARNTHTPFPERRTRGSVSRLTRHSSAHGSPNGRYKFTFSRYTIPFVVSALLQCQTWARSSRPIRLRDVHQPATRPQSRLSRAVMPPTVSACSLAEANLFSRMRPRAAMGQCDRTVRMPAPCPSRVRAAHPTIVPRAKFPTLLH